MTDTQRLLLAAVRAAPDADLPRLAYADYLEEAADLLPDPEYARLRATLIRGQIQDPHDVWRLTPPVKSVLVRGLTATTGGPEWRFDIVSSSGSIFLLRSHPGRRSEERTDKLELYRGFVQQCLLMPDAWLTDTLYQTEAVRQVEFHWSASLWVTDLNPKLAAHGPNVEVTLTGAAAGAGMRTTSCPRALGRSDFRHYVKNNRRCGLWTPQDALLLWRLLYPGVSVADGRWS